MHSQGRHCAWNTLPHWGNSSMTQKLKLRRGKGFPPTHLFSPCHPSPFQYEQSFGVKIDANKWLSFSAVCVLPIITSLSPWLSSIKCHHNQSVTGKKEMNQVFIIPSRKLIWKWCISWKPAKLYEKPDHLCRNEASRRGPHCNGKGICSFWLPCHNTPNQQQEGCVSHSFLSMNSLINWGPHYHLRFIVIINFVAAEWNKTQQLGTSS